jgi:hypothetical protein
MIDTSMCGGRRGAPASHAAYTVLFAETLPLSTIALGAALET